VYFRTAGLPGASGLAPAAACALALRALFFRPVADPRTADAPSRKPAREVAVTFDDLPGVVAPGEHVSQLRAITAKLVRAIAASSP
jgi:hypothetical protein